MGCARVRSAGPARVGESAARRTDSGDGGRALARGGSRSFGNASGRGTASRAGGASGDGNDAGDGTAFRRGACSLGGHFPLERTGAGVRARGGVSSESAG